MKPGRKPLPRDVKLAKGTLRRSRDKEGAPPPADDVRPPADLAGRALEGFREIVEEMRAAGTLSAAYRRTIAHLARVEDRAAQLREELEATEPDEQGRRLVREVTTVSGDRALKTNPVLTQLLEHEKEARHLYGILGLTPPGIVRAPKTSTKGPADGREEDGFTEFRAPPRR